MAGKSLETAYDVVGADAADHMRHFIHHRAIIVVTEPPIK